MYGSRAIIPLLTDPTYGLPFAVGVVATMAVAWWAFGRRATPPPLVPYASRRPWMHRPDTAAYQGLERGHFTPAVELLGRRLAEVLYNRYELRLDDRRALLTDARIPPLPGVVDLSALVDDLFQAFRSAQRAEMPNVGNSWAWYRRYRQSVAARDFVRITTEMAGAIPVLEAG